MSVKIVIREGESLGQALRRFKKLVERAGIRHAIGIKQFRMKPCKLRRERKHKAKLKAIKAAREIRRELGLP